MVKKWLLTVILAGSLLTAAVPGRSAPAEHQALPILRSVLEQRGVRLDRVELEGWALAEGDDPVEAWQRSGLADQLELQGGKLSIAGSGNDRTIRLTQHLPKYGDLSISLQKISKNGRDFCYLLVKGTLAEGSSAADWEKRLRRTLSEWGEEHGLYLTLQGSLPRTLNDTQEREWSNELYRQLGGGINSSQHSDRYLSLTGFAPVLGDGVMAGERKVNVSLALVRVKGSAATRVYLANPVITCEY